MPHQTTTTAEPQATGLQIHWLSPEGENIERPAELDQATFQALLDATIAFLRWIAAHRTSLAISKPAREILLKSLSPLDQARRFKLLHLGPKPAPHPESPLQSASWHLRFAAEPSSSETSTPLTVHLQWRARADTGILDVPQVLYEATTAFAKYRRKADIANWYYQNVQEAFALKAGSQYHRDARLFVSVFNHLAEKNENSLALDALCSHLSEALRALPPEENPAGNKSTLPPLNFSALQKLRVLPEPWKHIAGLLEVSYGLGMLRWEQPSSPSPSTQVRVLKRIDANVLKAKLFGLKSSIPGFDELFGGGLILFPNLRDTTPISAEPTGSSGSGVLAVVRGRFGAGKSTFAAQLAFDMASKGGAGALLVLEQSPAEILAQAEHFGWKPQAERSANIIAVEDEDALPTYEILAAHRQHKGLLAIQRLRDSSLNRFRSWLDDTTSIKEFENFHFRFLVVDPLEALQISPRDTSDGAGAHLLRTRTQQILAQAANRGFTLWLTTSHLDAEDPAFHYRFLPSIGDVVIRLGLQTTGERHQREHLNARQLRLFEVEKVRTQRFAEGPHAFEITSESGVHIYPSSDVATEFLTWFNNRPTPVPKTPTKCLSLGHPFLDFLLGPEPPNVQPTSVTTLMGPTGCAKTELALLFLLNQPALAEHERGLFIAFRDSWESIKQILKGPIGIPLGTDLVANPERYIDVLRLSVGNKSSGSLIQRIRQQFKSLGPGRRYTRVVVDNIAYMDLTTPLVREDYLFVPTLLELFEREGVTPLFNTSLVEGILSESKLHAQIRDASHNLIVLRRNRHYEHSFIAAQIYKSRQLTHQKQVFEIEIGTDADPFRVDDVRTQLQHLAKGPHGLENSGRSKIQDPQTSNAVEMRKNQEIRERLEAYEKQADEILTNMTPKDGDLYEHYKQRAVLADIVHKIYHLRCRDLSIETWVHPWPGESLPSWSPWARVAQLQPDSLFEWRRRYLGIMNRLERSPGLSFRLHTLDDYDRPLDENVKVERREPGAQGGEQPQPETLPGSTRREPIASE